MSTRRRPDKADRLAQITERKGLAPAPQPKPDGPRTPPPTVTG